MSSIPDDLGYSRDQFYRRVKLLTQTGLIQPERGKHNRLILSPRDQFVLRQFREIEQNNAELSLEACLALLRAEILQKELDVTKSQVDYLRAENTALRKALVRYRRWSIRRVWERVKSVFRRGRREQD